MAEYKDSYREVVDIAKEAIDIAKDLRKQNDDSIRLLDSYMHENSRLSLENNELKEKNELLRDRNKVLRDSHPTRHYDILNKPRWIKVKEGKTYKFECSRCHTDAYCVHYDENKETVCNYKYCPNCGVKMEIDYD